ncbi:MAG: molybdate ABC transporter substrate-binding protein [Burkholderiales bacterium]
MNTARLAGALALTIMLAQIADAAEIRVLSMPAMRATMEKLGPQFEGATGHKLSIRFGLPSQSREALESGAFDLAVLNARDIDDLVKQNKIIRATRADVARMGIGVAVRSGAPKPDISTVEAFKRTLLNARSISYTKDSLTGIYLANLMERLGIAEEMKAKTKLMGGGGQNPQAVAAGNVELGLSLVGDILPVAGIELLGLLPPELQQYAVVTVGVGTAAKELDAAQALVRFLTAPATTPVLKANGMEPAFR